MSNVSEMRNGWRCGGGEGRRLALIDAMSGTKFTSTFVGPQRVNARVNPCPLLDLQRGSLNEHPVLKAASSQSLQIARRGPAGKEHMQRGSALRLEALTCLILI